MWVRKSKFKNKSIHQDQNQAQEINLPHHPYLASSMMMNAKQIKNKENLQ